ncbi:MAG: hypothetical protein AAF921_23575 [Cyanobacteria bacterium P01_D01_bin.44]
MTYNTSAQTSGHLSGADRAIAALFAAGIMFIAGYTLVRVSLAQSATPQDASVINPVVPHEATLWADGFEAP